MVFFPLFYFWGGGGEFFIFFFFWFFLSFLFISSFGGGGGVFFFSFFFLWLGFFLVFFFFFPLFFILLRENNASLFPFPSSPSPLLSSRGRNEGVVVLSSLLFLSSLFSFFFSSGRRKGPLPNPFFGTRCWVFPFSRGPPLLASIEKKREKKDFTFFPLSFSISINRKGGRRDDFLPFLTYFLFFFLFFSFFFWENPPPSPSLLLYFTLFPPLKHLRDRDSSTFLSPLLHPFPLSH